jgi:hypothetical protein
VRLLWLITVLWPAVGAAAGPAFNGLLGFHPKDIEIVWAAPTNTRPPALSIYKVVTQTYSPAALSNLMALGGFTEADRVRGTGMISFRDKQKTRFLNLLPSTGWIRYWDNNATDTYKKQIQGVPSDAEVLEKTVRLLNQIGISRSDLATKPHSDDLLAFREEGRTDRFNKAKDERVSEIYLRGAFLIRRLDGINFAGTGVAGGCHAAFSLQGKLSWLEVVWPNLVKYDTKPVATAEEMAQWIKDGKAVLTHRNLIDARAVRKLTITEVAPMYMGEIGMERLDFVYPFAQLEATADLGATNSPVQIYCPIIPDN